jgi:predicted RNA-binding Zn ribbon-like protein
VGRSASTVGRFGLEPPPVGLRLVQDLINTALCGHQGQPGRDHLADLPAAEAWFRDAMVAWSAATGKQAPEISLQQRDLEPLRTLREQLRRSLRANAAHVDPVQHTGLDGPVASDVRLTLHANGQVGHQPLATGWEGVAGLIAIEMLVAGATGSLSRLKTCAAPLCGSCFHDGSPNRARVWHDTQLCGNVPNLRASRARRKALDSDV